MVSASWANETLTSIFQENMTLLEKIEDFCRKVNIALSLCLIVLRSFIKRSCKGKIEESLSSSSQYLNFSFKE
jgi:hypothetical protein